MMKLLLLVLLHVTVCICNNYVPVYVMLPLDTINNSNEVSDPETLTNQLSLLKSINVDGVMTDVWWGLVEQSPQYYNWSGYLQLTQLVQKVGLKLKVIMSFHQCGGNVNDACDIPIPDWVLKIGETNPDIFYTDREGNRDREYLSSGVDNIRMFPPNGRDAVTMYSDYMTSFASNFKQYYDTIVEVQIGLGPAGELRYPSYQTNNGWSFPGVGEFQCYDKYLLAELGNAANQSGNPQWGHSGPDNAGTYSSTPQDTGFFSNGDNNYSSPYGQFFLGWYSERLIQHGASILNAAGNIFNAYNMPIAGKVAGIHWLYKDPSHAAELTAGYKNDQGNGYLPITNMLSKYRATLDFTCLEMKDSQQPASCECGPEELVYQTLISAQQSGIAYEGENALIIYDANSYTQIEYEAGRVFPIHGLDYLRLSPTLLSSNNFQTFATFVQNMHTLE